ncbi:MAG: SusC/RagA family TonB-linked outer membrane protein [Bacteroides sp.]|nr:SusC/RagA family TonB-linked outer membrane protein [Bacteroides sp.]
MLSQEITISPNVKIVLNADSKLLDEVVVVAYGTAKRESLTGSVSVVDSRKIEQRITSTVTSALEGSAPGIMVNSTYGEPGTTPTIRIRGFNTLSTNTGASDPLYVVDGVPFDGSIADLNPADIESISVLKDAASAALYGNRAANGVILITTKKGKEYGKTSISLSINQGIYNRGLKEYDRLSADPWMEAQWTGMKNYAMTLSSLEYDEKAASDYATANLIGDLVKRNIYDAADDALFDTNGKLIAKQLPGYTDLDWFKELERNGHRQEYTFSATTAGEKYNVYSSVGYLKEDGYIIETGFERFSGRINSMFNPTKWLTSGINVYTTTQKQNYNSTAYSSYYANPFYMARNMAPVYPVYLHNADGSYTLDENGKKQYDLESDYLSNRHVIYERYADHEYRRRNSLGGQAYATIKLPYNIDVTVKGDLNHRTTNRTKYDNPNIGDGAANGGRLSNYAYEYRTYNVQQLINRNYDFGKHHVDLMLGHENYSYLMKLTYGMNTGMSIAGNYTMGNFTTNSYYQGYNQDYKTESYLSRARYNFDKKYHFDVSYRRDGSSRFHPDHRWGNFYSFGASWNIRKEEFMSTIDWVNSLKLRASYGEVGNDAGIDYYAYMALYNLDKNGGSGALVKRTLAANDIKWETTQTVDLGFEGRLFDRFNFSLGYFDKRSKDLLFEVKLPLSAGSYPFNSSSTNMTQYKNIGTISNRGLEFSADVDIFRKRTWGWNFGLNITFIKNKIIKLPDGTDILNGMQKFSEGHSIYEFFTYHFEGVDQMTGRSLYTLDPDMKETAMENESLVSINGIDYTLDTTYGLKDWAGSGTPRVYGSFHSTWNWKDLSLNALFTYQLGGKVCDLSYRSLMTTSAASASALHKDILKSWSGIPTGMTETSVDRIDKNGIPAINHNLSTYNNALSDRWLTSASYLVFKNINLSYRLPKKYLNTLGVEGLTVTTGIENLFTVTSRKGLNPQATFSGVSETGYEDNTYVTPRVYNIGLILKF